MSNEDRDDIAQIPHDEKQHFDFMQSFNGILPTLFLEVVTMDREEFIVAYTDVNGESPESWMGDNESDKWYWIQDPNGGGDYGMGSTLESAIADANDTLSSCEYTWDEFPNGTHGRTVE